MAMIYILTLPGEKTSASLPGSYDTHKDFVFVCTWQTSGVRNSVGIGCSWSLS